MAKRQIKIEGTKICPFCGERIKDIAIKCRFCNSYLGEEKHANNIADFDTFIRQALFSRFDIREEIGRGGMAVVYKAIQKNLNREIALKVIHPNLVNDSEFLERFHQEARVAASLNHPNIVKIFDEGEMQGVHFMAMEFLDGADLQHLIKRKEKLSVADTVNYGVQAANALNYIHARDLLHRDIKSSNIFITKDNRAVLTDFGIVRTNDGSNMTQLGAVFGTPEYMSPEQAKGSNLDERSDIYSLGVILYECLTGKVPFKGDTPLITINEVINSVPTPIISLRHDVPSLLNHLILQLLEKDPGKRIQDPGRLAWMLHNSLNPRQIQRKKKETAFKGFHDPNRKRYFGSIKPGKKIQNYQIFLLSLLLLLILLIIVLAGIYLANSNKPSNQQVAIDSIPVQPLFQPVVKKVDTVISPAVRHDTVQPFYPGGAKAIISFLSENVTIPDELKSISGNLNIVITVNPDGSVQLIRTVKSLSLDLDPLILKTLEALPGKFGPGRIGGVPQRMNYYLFIKLPL